MSSAAFVVGALIIKTKLLISPVQIFETKDTTSTLFLMYVRIKQGLVPLASEDDIFKAPLLKSHYSIGTPILWIMQCAYGQISYFSFKLNHDSPCIPNIGIYNASAAKFT